jgi:DNA adenine methylase
MTQQVKRPVLRYHGGKWNLAPWIISHFPQHKIYVEPFGGAASILLRKSRSYAEVYNDLDGEIVNLFRVLRNPSQARELIRLVQLTPFSRDEFEASYITADDPIEQARRTLLRSAAGYSTAGAGSNKWKTGFRGNVTRSGSTPAQDWQNFPTILNSVVGRLRGVVIENRPAIDVIKQYDGPDTLHYIDPPYPFETRHDRWAGNCYRHEMTDDQHRGLSTALRDVAGMVVVSGYTCPLYDELYSGWHSVTRGTYADGAKPRIETLWINHKARQLENALPLFRTTGNDR